MARLVVATLAVALWCGCTRSDCERYREQMERCHDPSTVETQTIAHGVTPERLQARCERDHARRTGMDELVACVLASEGRCARVRECQIESGLRTLQREGRLPTGH